MKTIGIRDQKIMRPSEYFEGPLSLWGSTGLSKRQKVKALGNWKDEILQLMRGDREGFGRKEETDLNKRLKEINLVLRIVEGSKAS